MNILISFSFIIVFVTSASAQNTQMLQLYRNMLTQQGDDLAKTYNQIDAKVNEDAVRALSQAEVGTILPLAFQCVHSADFNTSEAGFDFLISTMLRFDSASVLGPYIDDLGKLLDEKDLFRRPLVLLILGSLNPKLPKKAVEYLLANLESSRNSNQEALTIAACLLRAAPTDPSILHKVLLVVSSRSDSVLSNGVITQLGLSKIRLPEAIDYITANLNQEDEGLRTSAIDAASRMDKDTRAHFASQLTRIASDSKEPKYVRQQAAQALNP